MKINYAARVNIGKKDSNDDRLLVDGMLLDDSAIDGSAGFPLLVAVCDGCGGYSGGNIAAQSVLNILSGEDPNLLSDASYLAKVLERCQQHILKLKEDNSQYINMCTTIAGCVFCNNQIIVFHSGDSRVYRSDRWGIARMTKDHSLVQEMVDLGEISQEEAYQHPKRNVINRCIGVPSKPPEIYISHTSINPGEQFLVCSDGLWEGVSDDDIKAVLDMELSLIDKTSILVDKAILNGSDDNISVCICSSDERLVYEEKKPFVLD